MIVNYTESGWEVITQRAHGLLAAQVGMHWKVNQRPARWLETLLAIAEHDDAEVELDGEDLLTPAGGPLNFAMKTFDLDHCRKLSRLTITKSRYIALLTSMHMDFLYRDEASDNKEARKFLKEQNVLRDDLRKQIGMTKKSVEQVYNLLEWCDAFSLLLCRQQVQPEKRGIEISAGMRGEVYELFQQADETLTVFPWPFEEDEFSISVESRVITQLSFSSSEEFRQAFLAAPIKDNTWFLKNSTLKRQKGAKAKA